MCSSGDCHTCDSLYTSNRQNKYLNGCVVCIYSMPCCIYVFYQNTASLAHVDYLYTAALCSQYSPPNPATANKLCTATFHAEPFMQLAT